METDNAELFAGCTKWRGSIRDATQIPELVERAVSEALGGRPGPVALELPMDIGAGPAGELLDLAAERFQVQRGPAAPAS